MAETFLIFGHRGSPRSFPENTLASFDGALRAGADGFETDLRLLSDRTAVLYHDDEIAEVEVETLSSAALAERGAMLQRLEDLAPYAEKATMVLEVKRSKWEDALVEHVSGWRNVIVASFDHSTIETLHRRAVGFHLGITVFGYMVDIAEYAVRLGATWCFPGYHYVDEAMVNSLHARGVKVVPWTPNRPAEWARLRTLGCDGIITDLPAEAVQWRRESAGVTR